VNTTELIKHWTMQGAGPNLDERFRSIAGVFGGGTAEEPRGEVPDPLRMRGSDEEEWKPLLLTAGKK
jgi:hypothetical protein